MTDDLISRALILDEAKRISGPITGDGWDNWGVYGLIERQPSVPAVPLDKLCELCEETDTRVPCILCNKIMPERCKQNNDLPLSWDKKWNCPSWKQLLTKWMEEQR